MISKRRMNLHPFDEVADSAVVEIESGFDVYQQWECEHCHAKQTMPDRNKFYERGICEECGKETNIKKRGCNYMKATQNLRPVIASVMKGDS